MDQLFETTTPDARMVKGGHIKLFEATAPDACMVKGGHDKSSKANGPNKSWSPNIAHRHLIFFIRRKRVLDVGNSKDPGRIAASLMPSGIPIFLSSTLKCSRKVGP
jgi:hypothetical protein